MAILVPRVGEGIPEVTTPKKRIRYERRDLKKNADTVLTNLSLTIIGEYLRSLSGGRPQDFETDSSPRRAFLEFPQNA
jgi:hypothetical protein